MHIPSSVLSQSSTVDCAQILLTSSSRLKVEEENKDVARCLLQNYRVEVASVKLAVTLGDLELFSSFLERVHYPSIPAAELSFLALTTRIR